MFQTQGGSKCRPRPCSWPEAGYKEEESQQQRRSGLFTYKGRQKVLGLYGEVRTEASVKAENLEGLHWSEKGNHLPISSGVCLVFEGGKRSFLGKF